MASPEVLDQLDHPLPFLMATTCFVLGFAGILLWGAKNLKLLGLTRVIQQD